MTLTIFTPTYNRKDFLIPLYESLCCQTLKDFEWVIVDDGSSDGTECAVKAIKQRHHDTFDIRYYRKPNGGKHTAINLGVKIARGELFLMLDSDDELPPDAVSTIVRKYGEVKGNDRLAGICGYMAHRDHTVIGSSLMDMEASSLELRYRYGVSGDMCEVFRTEVLREFPFPEITGERFCPEALVWNRISVKYRLYIFPDVIYWRDYLVGGLTDNIVRIRMNSPIASMMTYAELNGYNIPFIQKVKAAINYWRFRLCAECKAVKPQLGKCWVWVVPIAWAMHLQDRRRVKTKNK